MSNEQRIAEHYFQLSNESDFENIARLLTDSTSYSSQSTGTYLGSEDIINMQRAFHDRFLSLHWDIKSVAEIKPGVMLFEYDFVATLKDGEQIESSGQEYVTIKNEKILDIKIRNNKQR